MIELNEKYIINPVYRFRSDIKRVILSNNKSMFFDNFDRSKDRSYSDSFLSILHPYVAYLFAFFNGELTLKDSISEISNIMGKPFESVLDVFSQYIENEEQKQYKMTPNRFAPIPINFIIKKGNGKTRNLLEGIDIEGMAKNIDLETVRFNIPEEVTLMTTQKCLTDCIYCYANKEHKIEKSLSFSRIKELIEEANRIGCRDFGIGGGDFFMYKEWSDLLDVLHENDFNPYISTKIPITEKIIAQLREKGVKRIQFSIDTVNREKQKVMLKVPYSYFDKMEKTLRLLNSYGIELNVKSVITKYNDDVKDVKELIQYLLKYDNLHSLSIAPGEFSSFKPFTYNTTKEKWYAIEKYVESLNNPMITVQKLMKPSFNKTFKERMDEHNRRALCTGNVCGFYMLPDGKATICEQTYWHPFFILGDVTNNSIMEVWNSPKALNLYNIKQSEFQRDSVCRKCKNFEECRRGKGACWRMAMQAYGDENYDYPYPECPYAPKVTRAFYIDPTA